jgi:GNAT superfamily N-acetyltransferase
MQERLQAQVLKVLKASPSGLQSEELAEKLSLTRHTIAKYLEVLRAEGKIYYHKIGRTKLWKELSATATIRLLNMSDLDAILRIEQRIEKERDSESPERMECLKETAIYHLQQGDPLMNLGAEIDGRLAGFVFGEIKLWEFGRGEKTGWIKVVAIDPDYQGKGVGHKLGETLLDHFRRKGVKRVWTLVDWYEGELVSYFKSLGFTMLSMIPMEKEMK